MMAGDIEAGVVRESSDDDNDEEDPTTPTAPNLPVAE
jgi:hypothetical protein